MDRWECDAELLHEYGKLGTTYYRSLIVQVHKSSYKSLEKALEMIAGDFDHNYSGFDPQISSISLPTVQTVLQSLSTSDARSIFRVIQVQKHESHHYQLLCGTSAGIVAFLVAADIIGPLRSALSDLIPNHFFPKCPQGFMPISGIPRYPRIFDPDTITAAELVNGLVRSRARLLRCWLGSYPFREMDVRGNTSAIADAEEFLLYLRDLEEDVFLELPHRFQFDPSDVVSQKTHIGIRELLEAHARMYDIMMVENFVTSFDLKEQLHQEMSSGNVYTAVMRHCEDVFGSTRVWDIVLAVDLALMTPVLSVFSPLVDRPLDWSDLHPGLRFERIVECIKDTPPLTQDDMHQRYNDRCEAICKELNWPTPLQMAGVLRGNLKYNREVIGEIRCYALDNFIASGSIRSETPSFFAMEGFGHIDKVATFLKSFHPPMQFWSDGFQLGRVIHPETVLNLLCTILANSLAEDCLYRSNLLNTYRLWGDIRRGLETYRERGIQRGGSPAPGGIYDLLDEFLNIVSRNTFGIELEGFRSFR